MSAIQVKNVPPDVHDALRAKAEAEGKTVGEVILEAIRRDLRREATHEWLLRIGSRPRTGPPPSRELVAEIMREARAEMWGADDDDGG